LGGERWDEKEEEGETEEESVGGWGYIMVFSDGITDGRISSVISSVKEPRHLSLNPSVIWRFPLTRTKFFVKSSVKLRYQSSDPL